jgi:flagellar hook-associated protein 1
MSSITGILSIASSAARAQQGAMQIVAQNVGNASTDGYSRQRVDLEATPPLVTPQGVFGTGVTIADVTRARDTLLDTTYRAQSADSSAASLHQDLLTGVQSIFNEPSDTGLAASLDAFWSSWSDLANNPSDPSAQSVVRARGTQVANLLNGYAQQLQSTQSNAAAQLTQSVQSFNQLTTQIADLNKQITSIESGGVQAPDLLDQRDRLLDQLSQLGSVRVFDGTNGSINVVLGGTTVVNGATAKTLAVSGSATAPQLTVGGDSTPLTQAGGSIGTLVTFLQTELPAVQTQLDGLAKGIVNGVNALHETGYTAAGDAIRVANGAPTVGANGSGIDFFDPAGVTAGTIKLSADVQNDSSVIASGTTSTGDNSVALAISALRDGTGVAALQAQMGSAAFDAQVGLPPNTSFGDSYQTLVTQLGSDVNAAGSDATAYQTLLQQTQTRRQSVSGVSLDEEMTRMMQYQQGYSAAAKVVQVANQMAQDILDMVP